MNLTTTEKYALAVLEVYDKPNALHKKERALCLAASCVWDMIQAKSVTADKKGKLRVSAPLPETLSYCTSVYERLSKKPMTPEKAAFDCIWTNKRIKTLVKNITDALIGKSVLVVEQQSSLRKAKLCHADNKMITEDIAAVKHMDNAATPDQTNLAVLLLESGTAKKLLSKQDLSTLKKVVKQTGGDFRTYVKKVKKMFQAVRTLLLTSVASSASSTT